MASKRAESRSRYYIREQAQKRGWKISHPAKGGECLEEQEIVDYFKDIGLGQNRPDFLFCINGMPSIVIEAKNESRTYLKIDLLGVNHVLPNRNINIFREIRLFMFR